MALKGAAERLRQQNYKGKEQKRTSSAPPSSEVRNRKKLKDRSPFGVDGTSSASVVEHSMLRGMLKMDEEPKPVPAEGLKKHEFNDDSEEEQEKPQRARSASNADGQLKKKTPKRDAMINGFVRERQGVVPPPTAADDSRRLLFDPDFACYYDPNTDSYFAVA